jgi:hypothetical protein
MLCSTHANVRRSTADPGCPLCAAEASVLAAARDTERLTAELRVTRARYAEIKRVLRESLLLEIDPGGAGAGTEGRDATTLYYLPFGYDVNNQFRAVVKYGVAIFANSYDEGPLALFRFLLSANLDAAIDRALRDARVRPGADDAAA